MARIKLMDTAIAEPTSRMGFELALESAENAMTEFAELAQQNEQLVIVELTEDVALDNKQDQDVEGIEEGLAVTRVGLNAINALNDTRLLIAPQIQQSTRQDIALVRQVATTAAAGMGIDPNELLPANMDDTVGQAMSLNMEGFKEKATAAIAAVWRFIQNIFDFAVGLLRTNFNLLRVRLARFVELANKILRARPDVEPFSGLNISVERNYDLLTPTGAIPQDADDIRQMLVNLTSQLKTFRATNGGSVKIILHPIVTATLDEVAERHKSLVAGMDIIYGKLSLQSLETEGNNLVVPGQVGGARLVVTNGATAMKSRKSADYGATQMEYVFSPSPERAGECPVINSRELREITQSFLEIWDEYLTPNMLVAAEKAAGIERRECEAEAAAYAKLLSQTDDGTAIAYITEISAMRRSLLTYRYSAFAQFSRTMADILDGMHKYALAMHTVHQKERKS